VRDPRIELVGRGYDAIADEYLEWAARVDGDPKLTYLDELSRRLPDGASMLELGCGAGESCTRLLAERFRVTGVDVSEEQISRARENVPSARFLRADFTELELEDVSFDAVAAFYALNHVPRELLGDLFARVRRWLVRDGLFLASLGASDTGEWIGDWLGTTMFFSGWDPEQNRALLHAAGFEIVVDELVTVREPEGDSTFQWVLARA